MRVKVAIVGLGFATSLPIALGCLALAGAADMVSALFRMTIWNETIPPTLRGRMASIEQLSGARIRVKLNGVEDTLHRPHHGDALGRQDIYHLREYLARSRVTPSQYEAQRKA